MTTVGETTIPTTLVRPAGDDTVLTLLVIRGDDTELTPTVAATRDEVVDDVREQDWTAQQTITYTVPGEWVFRWTATGTGADVDDLVVMVGPAGASSTRRAYATTADWAAYTGQVPPTGARQKLIEASEAVDDMLFGACYLTDGDGLPLQPEYADAVRDATVAQAAETVAEEKAALGVGSFNIGKLAVQRPAPAAVPRPRAGIYYSAAAWRILQRAGLTGHAFWVP